MSGPTDTPSLSELVRAFEAADDKDWEHLFKMLPDSGHGQFWKSVMTKARDTLSRLSGNGGGAATPSASLEEDLAEALVIIAGHGIEPDVQELLVYGNPSRGIKRGALAAVIRAFKAQAASERLSPPNLEPQCGVGEELRRVILESASRWDDLAAITEEEGPYTNTGFMRASARRLREALQASQGKT